MNDNLLHQYNYIKKSIIRNAFTIYVKWCWW